MVQCQLPRPEKCDAGVTFFSVRVSGRHTSEICIYMNGVLQLRCANMPFKMKNYPSSLGKDCGSGIVKKSKNLFFIHK